MTEELKPTVTAPVKDHPIYDIPDTNPTSLIGTVEIVDIKLITLSSRLRYAEDELSQAALQSLIDSIAQYGLLQPPLVDQNNVLQAGWRRYTACKLLGWTKIPVYRRERMSDSQYHEWELEENMRRLDFTWQQTVVGVCKVHRSRMTDAALKRTEWTQAKTGMLLGGYSKSYISNCLALEKYLERDWKTNAWLHPDVAECDGITDALRVLLRKQEDKAMALLAHKTLLVKATTPLFVPATEPTPKVLTTIDQLGNDVEVTREVIAPPAQPTGDALLENLLAEKQVEDLPPTVIDLSHMLFHGDNVDLLAGWPADCVDHIITDPPYGIDTDNMDQSSTSLMDTSRVDATHDVDENLAMFPLMLRGFHHVLKPGGYCILWCDIMNWQVLYDLAINVGFKVQRWPITWIKIGTCKNQMAHVNITKATEIAMLLRKGIASLPTPVGKNYFMAGNDNLKLSNPYAKPFDLWKYCIESVSIQGQLILEPFAGEGSGVLSMLKLNRRVLAIEKDINHFNVLLDEVKKYYTSTFRKVKFI